MRKASHAFAEWHSDFKTMKTHTYAFLFRWIKAQAGRAWTREKQMRSVFHVGGTKEQEQAP